MSKISFPRLFSSQNAYFLTFLRLNASARMKSVYVTRRVPLKAIETLKNAGLAVSQWDKDEAVPREELLKNVANCDALFCLLTEKIDGELLDAAGSRLRVIGTMSVGYDHVDVAEVKRRKIALGFTPEVLTEATAELTVALTLAVSRRLVEAEKQVRCGGWGTWGPMWMCGKGIQNSTVGFFGFGRIGKSVARKLATFQPKEILYHCKEDKGGGQLEISRPCRYVNFQSLLANSDFIIICASLTEQTKFVFNKEAFGMMKKDAIIVNTSSGVDRGWCPVYMSNNLKMKGQQL